jgi:hypothetical protein
MVSEKEAPSCAVRFDPRLHSAEGRRFSGSALMSWAHAARSSVFRPPRGGPPTSHDLPRGRIGAMAGRGNTGWAARRLVGRVWSSVFLSCTAGRAAGGRLGARWRARSWLNLPRVFMWASIQGQAVSSGNVRRSRSARRTHRKPEAARITRAYVISRPFEASSSLSPSRSPSQNSSRVYVSGSKVRLGSNILRP